VREGKLDLREIKFAYAEMKFGSPAIEIGFGGADVGPRHASVDAFDASRASLRHDFGLRDAKIGLRCASRGKGETDFDLAVA